MEYICGIDIGGTFTDCVIVDPSGRVVTTKAPSTPADFSTGMIDVLTQAASHLGLSLSELCGKINLLSHGTTVGTNAIIQKKGAKVGLITTKGHNDVIHMMRGSRGVTGQNIRLVVHFPESSKPDPIIPKRLIHGVSERVDCFGKVVVKLNEGEVREAVAHLLEKEVEAIAVCFLWSFKYPHHETRVKEIIAEMAPEMFVTCSCDLVPKWGEYERTTASALNAYIGPVTSGYLKNINSQLMSLGYRQPLQITQCAGGTVSVARAIEAPLLTLDSGPVSGVTGSEYLGRMMGYPNIITTDMGGTSFDVGIIFENAPAFSYVSLVNQYEYFLPKVDIQAIGSGGGSLAWIDEVTGTLRVGPQSAGAVPGPVCYGRGGEIPTVTDADLVLGYLNPDNFAGGAIHLDKEAASAAIGKLADALGMDLMACASGISTIAEFQMADLIRKTTIEKGFDPRDFVLFAFGGAGPAHAGVFARELGVSKVIVPQKETASVWCAFGAAAADILHVHEHVDIMASPFDLEKINGVLAELKTHSAEQLSKDAVPEENQQFRYSVDMRHRGQINEVEVDMEGEGLDAETLETLQKNFFRRYEMLYGKGASFAGARLEVVTFRCRASASTQKPLLTPGPEGETPVQAEAAVGSRMVYWQELKTQKDTPVYNGDLLVRGNRIEGPLVVETRDTTVVVHPGQILSVDSFGNFQITL